MAYDTMQIIATQTALPSVAFLTKREYAKHVSTSQRSLDYLREEGLPCLVFSTRKILFPVADCDQWMRDRFLVSRGKKGGIVQ